MWQALLLAHLVGLSLSVGAASAKMALLYRAHKDPAFRPTYLAVVRPLTRFIIAGLILLTVSGLGWIWLGYHLTPLLVLKFALVVVVWVLGPYIDNAVEPKFVKLMPAAGDVPSPEFIAIEKQYLAIESLATLLLWVVLVMGWRL